MTIKSTLYEEPTWFNTTRVTIAIFSSLRFENKLEMVIVRVGEEFSWTLP